jgi:hypothetical protein
MVSDVFQWKKSSHKTSSVSMGTKLSLIGDNTHHTAIQSRDYLQQMYHPAMLDALEQMVTCYSDHFKCKLNADGSKTSISMEHRDHMRALADKLYDRASKDLLNKYIDDEQKIANSERLKLEHAMCELYPKLNGIGGSTRNSFARSVIAHTLSENSVNVTSMLAQLRHDAITKETEALMGAVDRNYIAYVEADDKDYAKFLGAQQLLRGAWNKINYTDDTNENTDRNIRDFTLTGQWNRTAGTIADAADAYNGDQSAIDSFGGGISFP